MCIEKANLSSFDEISFAQRKILLRLCSLYLCSYAAMKHCCIAALLHSDIAAVQHGFMEGMGHCRLALLLGGFAV